MIRKIMAGVFAAVLVISMVWLTAIETQENAACENYEEAVRLAEVLPVSHSATDTEPETVQANAYTDPEIRKLQNMDIDALREVNRDVIGWICIPDTNVNYPLMRGEDNEHYLEYDWRNNPNTVGAIFMEHENTADFSDFNTIIYGHNMRSGAMFGGLKEYRSQSYWDEHPYIYIVNDRGAFRYDIFAAHQVRTDSFMYAMKISDTNQREEFIYFALENAQINTDIKPAADDRILTLSTCTGNSNTRWVVQGVLNEEQSYCNES